MSGAWSKFLDRGRGQCSLFDGSRGSPGTQRLSKVSPADRSRPFADQSPSCRLLVSRLQGLSRSASCLRTGIPFLSFPLAPGDPLQPSNTIDGGATAVPSPDRMQTPARAARRARSPRWASRDVRRVESRRGSAGRVRRGCHPTIAQRQRLTTWVGREPWVALARSAGAPVTRRVRRAHTAARGATRARPPACRLLGDADPPDRLVPIAPGHELLVQIMKASFLRPG
jgi:hypothetical protein